MKMRTSGISRRANVTDHLALFHVGAHGRREARQVRVARRHRLGVVDADEVAVAARPLGLANQPTRRSHNRRVSRSRDIETRMLVVSSIIAKSSADHSVDWRGQPTGTTGVNDGLGAAG